MKSLLISIFASVLFSAAAVASDMTTMEGKVVFDQGQYHLQAKDKSVALSGMNMQHLRKYEGKDVKIAGESKLTSLEVYKVFIKQGDTYQASYDWDMVNQDLYSN
jgi:opacity protein-like surface antigen